ncbi:hypothetical protein ARALYDRAFT_911491 [Arabidopsis lyrata subsp. lyrata]|uniref:Secreted protein n=1 Tax=Arabidopsis lyrata subsp. lyrata TaxID=81972 RepID=D7LZK5_ARALL|nr:hypothetical protein ARALYDRAFT_911491 [Arabidopsis lyrata subsp. lyrata]
MTFVFCAVSFLILEFFGQLQPLVFCQFDGSVCCNSREVLKLQRQFNAVKVLLCSVRPIYQTITHMFI